MGKDLFCVKSRTDLERPIFHTVLGRAASTVFNFLIALLVARHAGPAVKGEVTLLITTVWFFLLFSNILGGQILVYLIPRNKMELLVIPAYLWSTVVAGAGYVFLQLVPVVSAELVPLVILLSFLSALFGIHHTILLGRKQITNANVLQLIPLMLQLAGVLACFYFLKIHDARAYMYASVAAYLITVPLSFLMVMQFIKPSGFWKEFSWSDLRVSFQAGLLFQLVEVLQLLQLRYYFYQLGLQQGSQYLGVFSIGISILETVWIIPRGISTVHYVNTSNTSEIKAEVSRTVQLIKLSVGLSGLMLLLIFLIPSSIYVFVFGPGFSDVKHSMRFLYPGILVYSIPIVINSFYFGIGRYREIVISSVAGLVTVMALSYYLLPPYVMSGAGLAASVSLCVSAFLMFVYFVSENHLHFSDFKIGKSDFLLLKEKLILLRGK